MDTDERFIIRHKVPNYFWYTCELRYYDNPDSDWVLGATSTQRIEDAMQFSESKAKIIADILSIQEDEEGYVPRYEVVKV